MTLARSLRNLILAGASLGISATAVQAQPNLRAVKQTDGGYEIAGKGFGRDKAKVQVFEGMTQVSPSSIVSVADDLIVVHSKATGTVKIKVMVGGKASELDLTRTAVQDAAKTKAEEEAKKKAAEAKAKIEAEAKQKSGPVLKPGATPAGIAAASVVARPRSTLPSLTQTLTTPTASMTGNRGQAAPLSRPLPSLTQTLTTPTASMTGNRGQAAAAPPPPLPSITQTLTTPTASMTGNR